MALFFIILLGVSIAGLAALIAVKRWETASGRILWASVRPAVGATAHSALSWIERIAPALIRQWGERLARRGAAEFHRLVALTVIWTERALERTLHVLRRKTEAPRSGEASAFLREVSEHKKQLLQDPESRSIFDE